MKSTESQQGDSFQQMLDGIMALKPLESIERLLAALLPQAEKMIARRPRSFNKNGVEILPADGRQFLATPARGRPAIEPGQSPAYFWAGGARHSDWRKYLC